MAHSMSARRSVSPSIRNTSTAGSFARALPALAAAITTATVVRRAVLAMVLARNATSRLQAHPLTALSSSEKFAAVCKSSLFKVASYAMSTCRVAHLQHGPTDEQNLYQAFFQ